MKTLDQWLKEYQESHLNPFNIIIHKIFVPLIMLSVIGLIYCIPIPASLSDISFFNWSYLFVLACLVFYLSLGVKMFFGMLLMISPMLMIVSWIDHQGFLLKASIAIFIISWVFQFYGHKVEGKKPSFAKDLTFLLIGPLWVLNSLLISLEKKN